MGKRPWVRFYHMDWAASGTVQDMSMEEVGVYWTLLVRQMVDGHVNMDRSKLRRLFNVDTFEEVERLLSPKVMAKFTDVSGNPVLMRNTRLDEVIEETDAASNRNSANVRSRYDNVKAPPLLSSTNANSSSTPPSDLDFAPVIKAYPKLGMDKPGSERGVQQMLGEIKTAEEMALLVAACKRYADEKKGEQQRFIKSFNNFMAEWRSWIPKKMARAHLSVVEVSPTPKQEAPAGPALPPWENIEPGTSQTAREVIDQLWTEEKKREWLASNNQAGVLQ